MATRSRKQKRYKAIADIFTPEEMEFYLNDPIAFVEDAIFRREAKINGGIYFVTDQQREIMLSVLNNDLTSVAAGRGIGKTGCLSWIIIWWMTMFCHPKIVAIAPSFPQLQSVLWPEINKWLKMSALKDTIKWGRKRCYLYEDPSNSFAEPKTASKEESMQGFHEDNLLILIDEASGVDDSIWEVVQGSITHNNNKVCLMSNPTRISGFFYDTHHGEKDIWKTFQFSSEDTPEPVMDSKYIARMKFKYVHDGIVHDMYKIHVQGKFPSGDPSAFFTMDQIQATMNRVTTTPEGDVQIGVDVARMGNDQTVIAVRQGFYYFSAQELGLFNNEGEQSLYVNSKTRTTETTSMVLAAVEAVRRKQDYFKTVRIVVDDNGVGGGVTDELLEVARDYNIEVIPCDSWGPTTKYDWEGDEITHMWADFEKHLDKFRLPDDRFLLEELTTRRWKPDNRGKRRLECKEDYRKFFHCSPDRADAVMLAFTNIERAKLMANSFQSTLSNTLRVNSSRMMGTGKSYIGIYSSPKGNISIVGVSFMGPKVGVWFHKEGTVDDLSEDISMLSFRSRIVGSDSMFGDGMCLGTRFMMNGIPVAKAFNYDERSAIAELDKATNEERLVVATECDDLMKQLRTWKQEKANTELWETHGGCYALLLTLSELRTANGMDCLTGRSF